MVGSTACNTFSGFYASISFAKYRTIMLSATFSCLAFLLHKITEPRICSVWFLWSVEFIARHEFHIPKVFRANQVEVSEIYGGNKNGSFVSFRCGFRVSQKSLGSSKNVHVFKENCKRYNSFKETDYQAINRTPSLALLIILLATKAQLQISVHYQ